MVELLRGASERGRRPIQYSHFGQCAPELKTRLGKIRAERDRLAEALYGGAGVVLVPQRLAEIVERGGLVRGQAQRSGETDRRLIRPLQIRQDATEIVMGFPKIRPHLQDTPVRHDRFIEPFLLMQCAPQIKVQSGLIRRNRQGATQRRFRLGKPPKRLSGMNCSI